MTKRAKKLRLDLHLLTKGLVSSREKAQQLIRAGQIRGLHGEVLDKPGMEVSVELDLIVKEEPRFVSRGGEKLVGALNEFALNVKDRICLDCGISTGGFTDCLLQHDASKVYGIDVGYGQIAWKIRNDPRVVLLERTNLRKLTFEKLYGQSDEQASLAVADLSFISLRLVLPVIKSLLKSEGGEAVLLVKPQFEVGPERIDKGGIVRDPLAHIFALNAVMKSILDLDWAIKGIIPSPIKGRGGNQEYLLWSGECGSECRSLDVKEVVNKVFN